MSNQESVSVMDRPLSAREDAAKTNALIGYGLMALGLCTGIFFIIGVVWAAIKRSDAVGTMFEDHYTNIIRTFWWGLLFAVIGWILTLVLIGFFVLFVAWVWVIYRVVKGLLRITSNRSYYV